MYTTSSVPLGTPGSCIEPLPDPGPKLTFAEAAVRDSLWDELAATSSSTLSQKKELQIMTTDMTKTCGYSIPMRKCRKCRKKSFFQGLCRHQHRGPAHVAALLPRTWCFRASGKGFALSPSFGYRRTRLVDEAQILKLTGGASEVQHQQGPPKQLAERES